jgi:hypothetical protein
MLATALTACYLVEGRTGPQGVLITCEWLILFPKKCESNKLLFMICDTKVLRDL